MKSDGTRREIQELIDAGVLVVNDGYRAKNTELGQIGLPFARAANVNAGFHLEEADRLVSERVDRAGIKRSRPGDVVFTSKGTVGRFAFVRDGTPEFVYSPQLCFWRVLDPSVIEPRYLYYWMHGRECEHQFNAAKGSTDMADYISLRDQRAMSITLPSVKVQRCIAQVLGSLDEKIENNRRLAWTLEEIATALFKARFVDFLDHDDLVESEIGPIPRGWSAGALSEIATVTMGQSPPSSTYTSDSGAGPLMVQGKGSFGPRFPRREVFCGAPGRLAQAGDILMTVRAPVGSLNICAEETCLGRGVAGISSSDPGFVEFALRAAASRWHAHESGTIYSAVNKKQVEGFLVVIPPPLLLEQFETTVAPMREMIAFCHREIETLGGLRDHLLPRLVAGSLRVDHRGGTAS